MIKRNGVKRSSRRLAAQAAIALTVIATTAMAPDRINSYLGARSALAQDRPAADAKPDGAPAVNETKPSDAKPADTKGADAKPVLEIGILYVRQLREQPLPLSLLDIPAADNGIGGANLAVADNNTTGKFLNQTFKLEVIEGS
nr:hypothetical protein [Hyphomicrobium sp.]